MPRTTLKRPRRSAADKKVVDTLMGRLRIGKDARLKKVAGVRRSLRDDRYVNTLKWDVALDRLIDQAR